MECQKMVASVNVEKKLKTYTTPGHHYLTIIPPIHKAVSHYRTIFSTKKLYAVRSHTSHRIVEKRVVTLPNIGIKKPSIETVLNYVCSMPQKRNQVCFKNKYSKMFEYDFNMTSD